MSDLEMNDLSEEEDLDIDPLPDIKRTLDFQAAEAEAVTSDKTMLVQTTTAPERMPVYLRIRPFSHDDLKRNENQECMNITDNKTLVAVAPASSHTFKTSQHGQGKTKHQFSFTRIFDDKTSQKQFFEDTVLNTVHEFVKGQNCLVFSYGVTNSGKTYTIQGTPKEAGILPRALDVLFTVSSSKLLESTSLRPNMFCDVVKLSSSDREAHVRLKETLFKMVDSEDADMSCLVQEQSVVDNSILSEDSLMKESVVSSRSSIMTDSLEEGTMDVSKMNTTAFDISTQGDIKVIIYVSFAEIYNEQIYDLLAPLQKRKTAKRPVLQMREDKHGAPYIKGLHEIHVTSAEEAYRLLALGRNNLQMACTRLNHNSSRSHCIFTVKMIRVVNVADPKMAHVSMLSFCDLAGSERYTKTQSKGDRIKEAGNINSSLLTLGRCITALRHNQQHKDHPQVVPFRDSKLTRLFQSFFCGKGRALMIVNINQCAGAFDETLHALKYSAVAKQVIIEEPPPPAKLPPIPHRSKISIFLSQPSNRATLAWASPSGKVYGDDEAEMIAEVPLPDDDDNDIFTDTEDSDNERVKELEESVELLTQALIKARQDNAQMEMRIRNEVCDEMAKQLVEIERGYSERFKQQQQQAEEMTEKQMQLLAYSIKANNRLKRRRPLDADSSSDEEEAVACTPTTSKSKACGLTQQVEIDALHQQLSDKETEMNTLKTTLSQETSQLKEKLFVLQEQLHEHSSLEDLVSQLTEEKRQLMLQISEAETSREQSRTSDNSLDMNELVIRLADADTELEARQEQITKLQQVVDLLQCQLCDKDTALTSIKSECLLQTNKEQAELKAMCCDLQNSLSDKVRENAELIAEIADLKAESTIAASSQNTASSTTHHEYNLPTSEQSLSQLEKKNKLAEETINEKELELDELKCRLSDLQAEISKQDLNLSRVKESLMEAEKTLVSRNREIQELQLDYCHIKQESNEHQHKLDDYIIKVNQQAELIGQLQDEQKHLAQAKEREKKVKTEFVLAQTKLSDLSSQLESKDIELHRLENLVQTFNNKATLSQDIVSNRENGHKEESYMELTQLKEQHKEVTERCTLLERDLSAAVKDKESLMEQLKTAGGNLQLEEIKRQLTNVQNEAHCWEEALNRRERESEEEIQVLKQTYQNELQAMQAEFDQKLSQQTANCVGGTAEPNHDLSTETLHLNTENGQYKSKVSLLEEVLSKNQALKENLELKCTELELCHGQCDSLAKNVVSLEEELKVARSECQHLEKNLAFASEEQEVALTRLKEDLEVVRAEAQRFEEALSVREQQNEQEVLSLRQNWQQELSVIRAEHENHISKLECERGVESKAVKQCEEASGHLFAELKEKVKEYEDIIQDLKEKLSSTKAAHVLSEEKVKQSASDAYDALSAEFKQYRKNQEETMSLLKQEKSDAVKRLKQEQHDSTDKLVFEKEEITAEMTLMKEKLDEVEKRSAKLEQEHADLVSQSEELEQVRKDDMDKATRLQEDLAVKMMSCTKMESECERLASLLEQKKACLSRSEEAAIKLETENSKMKEELLKSAENEILLKELEQKVSDTENTRSEAQRKLADAEAKMKKERSEKCAEISSLKTQLEEQVSCAAEADREKQAAVKISEQCQDESHKLQEEMSILKQASLNNEKDKLELQKQLQNLEKSRDNAVETIRSEVKLKDAALSSYKRELEIHKEELALFNQQLVQKEMKEKTLQQDLTDAAQRIREQDERYVALEASFKESEEKITQELETTKTELLSARTQMKKRDEGVQDSEAELSISKLKIRQLERKLDTANNKLKTSSEAALARQEEIHGLKEAVAERTQQLEQYKQNEMNHTMAMTEQERTMSQQDTRIQTLEDEMEELRKAYEDVHDAYKQASLKHQEDTDKSSSDLISAQQALKQVTAKQVDTKGELRRIEQQLEDSQRDLEQFTRKSHAELDQYKEKVRLLEEENKNLSLKSQEESNDKGQVKVQTLKLKYQTLEEENSKLLTQMKQIEHQKSSELEKWRQERDKLVEGLESVLKQKDSRITDLEKENNDLLSRQKLELRKVIKAKDQIIEEMRGQNQILQGHLPQNNRIKSTSLKEPGNTIKEEPELEKENKTAQKSRKTRRTTQNRKRTNSNMTPAKPLVENGQEAESPVKAPPRRRRKLANPDESRLDIPADESFVEPPPGSPHLVVGRRLRSRKR